MLAKQTVDDKVEGRVKDDDQRDQWCEVIIGLATRLLLWGGHFEPDMTDWVGQLTYHEHQDDHQQG